MQPLLLRDPATGSCARIAAHLGFNCYEFQAIVGGHPVNVLDAAPDFPDGRQRPSGHGIPLLFPFPNRIRSGKFHWQGRDYTLPSGLVGYDGTGNAIHGFAIDRPWRITAQGENFAVGEFRLSTDAPDRLPCWPGDCSIAVRYEVRGGLLRADVTIANPGDASVPWGFGTHPYFRLPLGTHSDAQMCLVEAPASEEWELIDCLPTGVRRPIDPDKDLREGAYFEGLKLDDVFTGLTPQHNRVECFLLDGKSGLQVSQRWDPVFRELVVYTPPNRDAICLEPYTCVTDAINLAARNIDTGLRTLGPGEEFRTWIEIEAGPILV